MKMELSVREAATLLGRPARTLRGQLKRGEIRGVMRDGAWRIPREHLPMTDAQRAALQGRADEARRAVEDALPSRLAVTAARTPKSLLDLDGFRIGRDLLFDMRRATDDRDEPIEACLEDALCVLARGKFAFQADEKRRILNDARDRFSACLARVLLSADPLLDPRVRWAARLERELIPSISGLLRWTERLERKAAR